MAEEFEALLKEFSNEVHKLVSCYLLWRTFNQKISDDKELLKKLNDTPLSWIFIRHSLQVNVFIILGRLFDNDKKALSAGKMLKLCCHQIKNFSIEELKKRKMKATNGQEPEWLEEYCESKTDLKASHFINLNVELETQKKIYTEKYQPIRDKLFAHKQKNIISKVDGLWSKTNIDEFEELVLFFPRLEEALFQSYQNGALPQIKKSEPDFDHYHRDFESFMDNQRNV